MSAYQKLIKELLEKKKEQVGEEINWDGVEEIYEDISEEIYEEISEEIKDEIVEEFEDVVQKPNSPLINQDLMEKLGDYQKNTALFDLLFMDVMKKNDMKPDELNVELEQEEKEKILKLVLDLIKQFEEMEIKEEVKGEVKEDK